MENLQFVKEFPIGKGGFSIAMLDYRSVTTINTGLKTCVTGVITTVFSGVVSPYFYVSFRLFQPLLWNTTQATFSNRPIKGFLSYLRGLPGVCDIGVCCIFLGKKKTPLKTNMTGWKIPMFKSEIHLHSWWVETIAMFRGGNTYEIWKICRN